jgi:hypothetical protein
VVAASAAPIGESTSIIFVLEHREHVLYRLLLLQIEYIIAGINRNQIRISVMKIDPFFRAIGSPIVPQSLQIFFISSPLVVFEQ